MKRFVLTRPAERDLEQIKIFLVQKAGPVIARRVLKDIRDRWSFSVTNQARAMFAKILPTVP
jgi:plasmid stabilization system protein ParE